MANAINLEPQGVTCTKADLVKALDRVLAGHSKGYMALLDHVLVESDGTSVRLTMTDVTTHVTAEVSALGSAFRALVACKALSERVKKMAKGPVSLAPGAALGLTVGPYTLPGVSPDEFPEIAHLTHGSRTVAADTFRAMLDRTFRSISTDDTRVHLNSLLLEWSGAELTIVATDGHRLSFERAAVGARSEPEPLTCLLPRASVVAIRKAIAKADGLVSIAFAKGGKASSHPAEVARRHASVATVRADGVSVTCKCPDVAFPPYQQVIPSDDGPGRHSVRLNRMRLVEAIRTVAVAASERTGGIVLDVGPFGFKLSAKSPDNGEAHAEVYPVGDCIPAEVKIGVNARYLLDALEPLECDEITFVCSELNAKDKARNQGPGSLDPMKVSPAGATDSLTVCMPMRI